MAARSPNAYAFPPNSSTPSAPPWPRISPILYRDTSMEDVPERHRLGNNVELCRALTDAGVNAFDITAGMQCCFELMTPPTCMPKA